MFPFIYIIFINCNIETCTEILFIKTVTSQKKKIGLTYKKYSQHFMCTLCRLGKF